MLYFPCYVLLCHAHILEGLYDLISVESNRLLGIRIDSNRVDSSRFVKNFHLPAHLFASSVKRTSGESEVFDPRADSNRLCFKTIRLSLGVLDMSDPASYVGCLLLVLVLAPRVFSRSSSFSSLLKNQHFQVPIRSGIRGAQVYQSKTVQCHPR